jgi:HSP20 family protein
MLWADFDRFGRFFDPWRDLDRMQKAFSGYLTSGAGEFPAVNVWMNGDQAVVLTEIPGIEPSSVDISVVGKTLTLRGSRQPAELKEGESFHRSERWSGRFSRTVDLPFAIDANKVEAKFTRGVLSVTLPRAEADKPRKIAVKTEA